MADQNIRIQFLRGNTQDSDAYQGREGELTVDTQKKELRLHDGSTPGGKSIGRLPEDVWVGNVDLGTLE